MKIKFNEPIRLAIDDGNWGEEYRKKFAKDQEVEILGLVPNTHGYVDIHFSHKVVAESVHNSVFTVLT